MTRPFRPLQPGDNGLGEECRLCGETLLLGERPALVPKEKPAPGGPRCVEGVIIHWTCHRATDRLQAAVEFGPPSYTEEEVREVAGSAFQEGVVWQSDPRETLSSRVAAEERCLHDVVDRLREKRAKR